LAAKKQKISSHLSAYVPFILAQAGIQHGSPLARGRADAEADFAALNPGYQMPEQRA
jgi:hypothetical protein